MAKASKSNKQNAASNSRAARRGVSPTGELAVKEPHETDEYKSWQHGVQNAGVVKKKKKPKQLSKQQKLRQHRGLEKAVQDLDKLEKKVAGSQQRARRVQARRVDWEDLNNSLANSTTEAKNPTSSRKKNAKVNDNLIQEAEETIQPAVRDTLSHPATETSSTETLPTETLPTVIDEIL